MKRLILWIIPLVFILGLSFVSAVRYEDNLFRYGEIDTSGNLVTTNTLINDVDVIGFICNNAACSTISGDLWSGAILHSAGDFLQLEYPTTLQSSHGYGVYMYKDGYIPYEVNADWWGTNANDPVGPFNNYLSKKRVCIPEIVDMNVSSSGGNVDINVEIQSPIENAGPLDYIPPAIQNQYEVEVDIHLNVSENSTEYYSETKTLDIEYSKSEDVSFSFPAPAGSYSVYVYTTTDDSKCIDYEPDSREENKTISCNSDAECGIAACFEIDNYCLGLELWHRYSTNVCVNPGQENSYCSIETTDLNIAHCVYTCNNITGRCLTN